MPEELNTVEPTTGIGQENAPDTAVGQKKPPEGIAPEQDLAAFSLGGLTGIAVDDRRQAGQGSVLSFVRGEKISQGVEGGSELLQQEFGVPEVVIGMEESSKSPTFSPGLQKALSENPDFLFPFSPLGKLATIQTRRGESIFPEHPDLQAVRRLAEGYIPEVLPGNSPKHQLPSLGNVNEGTVASDIAKDIGVLAMTRPGPTGIVRDNPVVAGIWEELKKDARVAA